MQDSFFIPGKTFAKHQLLDVNKLHYIFACANIHELVEDVKQEMVFYRGIFDYTTHTDKFFHQYAVVNRFDGEKTIFINRMLQTVLRKD